MAFVSDDLYNEICMANDIVDYASSFLTLKKSGRSYMACCPFHNEKTPSFHIDRDKQLFHCFGCGASGNFVQFVMRMEGLDYRDALRQLADRAGIVIPENGVMQSTELTEKKDRIIEMNRLAARFFFDCLTDERKGADARRYFASRKLSKKTIIKFGLGYAPDSTDELVNFMHEKGYTDSQLVEAGLAVERKGRVIDKFRNRVMFPIINVRKKVIGFGGRVLGSEVLESGFKLAKYLNTPETPVFDKGSNLFALNLAKNANATDIILCEGYMDVITVHQAGIENCVATLGTAITEGQAKLMLRYGREILICYDMDEAGTKAALRAIDIIASVGGKSRVVRIDGAKDPDEYISKYGVSGFKKAVDKALPSTEFRLLLIKRKYDLEDTDGKIRFIEEAARIFTNIADPVEVEAYIKKTAQDTGLSEQSIYGKYAEIKGHFRPKPPAKTREEYQRREINRINNEKPKDERITQTVLEAEKKVLSLMAQGKKLCMKAQELMPYDEFSNHVYRTLAKRMVECVENGKSIEIASILNEFSGDLHIENLAAAAFVNPEVYESDEASLLENIYTIKLGRLDAKINASTDDLETGRLIMERQKLIRRKEQEMKRVKQEETL